MNYKRIFLLLVIIILITIIFLSYYKFSISEKDTYPNLILKNTRTIVLKSGDNYQEPGYLASDKIDGDITSKVKINGIVNTSSPGTYKLTYEVTNSKGNKTKAYRYIKVEVEEIKEYRDSYDKIDNTQKGWWSGNKKDHSIPLGGEKAEILQKYNAYFKGKKEKVIYLTFDEGSEDTYLKEIVNVLDKNDVKATFFLCRRYILDNAKLMKRLVKNGHSVGNHTANHKKMPTLANRVNFDTYLKEIKITEDAFYQVTNTKMDKIYREPAGEWSFRSLQMVKDLGYRTYFWSASYMDFGENVSKEKALSEMLKLYHEGAIYLLHPKNKGNYEALDDFIKIMKKKGYRFDLVRNI